MQRFGGLDAPKGKKERPRQSYDEVEAGDDGVNGQETRDAIGGEGE